MIMTNKELQSLLRIYPSETRVVVTWPGGDPLNTLEVKDVTYVEILDDGIPSWKLLLELERA